MTISPIFLRFADELIEREGGSTFTNRAADRGGPTRWGVTAKKLGEWRKLGRPATEAEVRHLDRPEALAIYNSDFFVEPGFEGVAAISPRIAEELLDTAVNMGPYWPSTWLQENLNLFNNRGRDWPDVFVDAELGGKTLAALRLFFQRRGVRMAEDLMLRGLNGDQWARYKMIASQGGANNSQEENFVGWISKRIGTLA